VKRVTFLAVIERHIEYLLLIQEITLKLQPECVAILTPNFTLHALTFFYLSLSPIKRLI
jgi:hypothetical protein